MNQQHAPESAPAQAKATDDAKAETKTARDGETSGPVNNTASGDCQSEMTLLQTFQSVLWAMLGVQNKKNARRDFSKGKPSHFIIIGIVLAVVFILTLVSIIRMVLGDLV